MIPKRIFYVWLGEKKPRLVEICLENWRITLPDYEIIEVSDKTPEWFDFEYEYNNNLWFKTVYDLKLWAYVSDYIRFKVLYAHGGIYLDTDITVYKDFEPLLNNEMFVGNMKNNLPELAVIGVKREHPILKSLINFYDEKIWNFPEFITCKIFNRVINEEFNIKNEKCNEVIQSKFLTIYPYYYFYPIHLDDEFDYHMVKPETYTVHWGDCSWATKKNLFFLTNKHRIPLKTLLKQLDFIEKSDNNANKKTIIK